MRQLTVFVILSALIIPRAVGADYESAFMRGTKLAKQRNYVKALDAFREAIRSDPTQVDAYLNAGNIARHLKMCREVLLYYKGFLYLSPSDPEARNAKAAMTACEKGTGTLILKAVSPTDGASVNGVEVFIEDGLIDRTPLPEVKLMPGNYRIRLSHPDFEPVSEDVTIKAGETTEVSLGLKKKLLYGFLEIKTNPEEGVAVFLDDEQVGVTPLKDKLKLETRKFLIRLEKPGYDRWIRYVTIERDRTITVEATLEPTTPSK